MLKNKEIAEAINSINLKALNIGRFFKVFHLLATYMNNENVDPNKENLFKNFIVSLDLIKINFNKNINIVFILFNFNLIIFFLYLFVFTNVL